MAVTKEASGTQSATPDMTHTLATLADTVDKVVQLEVDISALAAGEYVELTQENTTLNGGTARKRHSRIFSWLDASISAIAELPPIMVDEGAVFKLKQIGGTGRSFPWAVKTP